MYAIAIHGGAGAMPRDRLSPEAQQRLHAGLQSALDAGYAVLERGGSSLDAVTAAVRVLEDDPQFNAGRGAVLTRGGTVELDASIMDGRSLRAGAVASVRHVRNPVELARLVMEHSRHVLLVGSGAEEFALEHGMSLVANEYFRTEERARELAIVRAGSRVSELIPVPGGTVGAVALDRDGNLAAATSTGGMTNKRHGRVGDRRSSAPAPTRATACARYPRPVTARRSSAPWPRITSACRSSSADSRSSRRCARCCTSGSVRSERGEASLRSMRGETPCWSSRPKGCSGAAGTRAAATKSPCSAIPETSPPRRRAAHTASLNGSSVLPGAASRSCVPSQYTQPFRPRALAR